MPVPAQRRPAYEGRVRRNANFVLNKVEAVTCPKCKSLVKAHRVCPLCGTYKGREIVKSKIDKKTAKKMNKKAVNEKKSAKATEEKKNK